MKVPFKELSERQKKFCREYIIDNNGQNAAIRAGYAKSSAHVRACKLLKQELVKQELNRLLEKQVKRTEVSADKIENELAVMGFFDIDNSETKLKYSDKIKALELIMKRKGLLSEKLQIENVDKGVTVEDLGLPLEEAKKLLSLVQQAKLNKESLQE